ncbi:MAG TPA: hypothetical protein VF688_12075 [Allosphingosinicella sp.]
MYRDARFGRAPPAPSRPGGRGPAPFRAILLILETSGRGLYWVFTQNHGLARGVPYPVIDETGSAIPFEETAIERLWGRYLK